MKRHALRWLALVALLLAGCRADQATKAWAVRQFKDEPRTMVPGVLEFRYAENRAIAFSMLKDVPGRIRTPLIFGLAGVSLLALGAYGWGRRREGALRMIPLAMILAGALGNLQDRIAHGYVVDFVRVHWHQSWSFPIFNLADSLISVGMALLILQAFRTREVDGVETGGTGSPAR